MIPPPLSQSIPYLHYKFPVLLYLPLLFFIFISFPFTFFPTSFHISYLPSPALDLFPFLDAYFFLFLYYFTHTSSFAPSSHSSTHSFSLHLTISLTFVLPSLPILPTEISFPSLPPLCHSVPGGRVMVSPARSQTEGHQWRPK